MTAGATDSLYVYDSDAEKTAALKDAGVPFEPADSLERLAEMCDALVLCVKPNIMDDVLDALAACGAGASEEEERGGSPSSPERDGSPSAPERGGSPSSPERDGSPSSPERGGSPSSPERGGKLIISIAAGISIDHIRKKLGARTRAVRVMPNTPAMVGEGMSVMSAPGGLPAEDKDAAERLFNAVGAVVWAPEELMDTVTGISGSSPAYAYLYIEGLVRAGMEGGLSKETATVLAAQSTLGAAKMVMENLGITEPRRLCENVCSPGGTTIEAVKVLEEAGFTNTVCKAAQASAAKSKLMTR